MKNRAYYQAMMMTTTQDLDESITSLVRCTVESMDRVKSHDTAAHLPSVVWERRSTTSVHNQNRVTAFKAIASVKSASAFYGMSQDRLLTIV